MDPELPHDMISEVLMRTSLDTLDKCKSLSKGWKELIYDSTFFPFYLENTGTLFGFFVQDICNDTNISQFVGVDQTGGGGCINESWPSGNVKILASSNQGIVCCEKRSDKGVRWYVGKPTTKQWKAIPNPKLRHKTIGVAIIVTKSKPFRFKIIRLSELNITDGIACEVFNSTTWNWERITQTKCLDYDEFIDAHEPAITTGDSTYWKTTSNKVLTFSASQQQFNKFSLPQIDGNAQQWRLMEYQGRLGSSCSTRNGNVQLWVISCGNNYEWERKMDVETKLLEETFTYPSLVGFCNSGTLFVIGFNQAIFFNVKDGTFINKEICFKLRHARQFFQFRSDVQHVHLKCVDQED